MTGPSSDSNDVRQPSSSPRVHAGRAEGLPVGVEVLTYLGRGRLGETWLVRGQDGVLAAAKRLRPGTAAADGEPGTLRRLTEVRDPHLVSVRGAEVRGGCSWVFGDLCEGVTLRRMMAVASLTAGQWVVIGRAVLGGLVALHGHGLVHGALHPGNVYVTPDGTARLADGGLAVPEPEAADRDALQHADVMAAWCLLRGGVAAARRPQSWPPGLTQIVAADPPGDAAASAQLLLEATGDLGSAQGLARARSQIAALVVPLLRGRQAALPAGRSGDRLTRGAVGAPPPVAAPPTRPPSRAWAAGPPAPAAPPPAPPPPAGVRGPERARPPAVLPVPAAPVGPVGPAEPVGPVGPPLGSMERPDGPVPRPPGGGGDGAPGKVVVPTRLVVAGVGATLATLALLAGVAHLLEPGPRATAPSSGVPSLVTPAPATPSPAPAATAPPSPSPPPSPAPSATASGLAIPVLAPPAAGEVSAVIVEPLGGCSPSSTCTVGVRVNLTAHPQEMVGWVLEVIDRCTGRRTEVAVHPVPAPPSYLFVYSTTTVVLPAAPASAIVALTTLPTQAASTPLLIPSAEAGCV